MDLSMGPILCNVDKRNLNIPPAPTCFMPLLGFNETTIALLFVFAFFVIVTYSVIKLVIKVAAIAVISMAFPVALNYLGFYGDLSIDAMLVFGILGSMFYLVYFFVDKALGFVWPIT